jgi:hypothetical protein
MSSRISASRTAGQSLFKSSTGSIFAWLSSSYSLRAKLVTTGLRNNVMITAKDLTKEAPRSLCQRVQGYAVLARMADKGRATINGTMGDYHFNCPLDNMLFGFKGVQAEDVKSLLASGATDEQVAAWLDQNGIPKTADEIKAWSDSVEAIQPYQNPEDRDWFVSECARLGIDPVKSRLCDYLDTDDRLSFAKIAG